MDLHYTVQFVKGDITVSFCCAGDSNFLVAEVK